MIAESTTMLGELENSLGVPTFAFFAHWIGEYSVDADEKAGRLLASSIVERHRREQVDQIALILASRGGYPAFADVVVRTVRQLGVKLQVVVPCRIDGAAGLVALASDHVTLHPRAGIGAVDSGLCVVPHRDFDALLQPHSPIDPLALLTLEEGQRASVARLAHDRLIRDEQRRTAGHILASRGLDETLVESVLEATLGSGLTVGVTQLEEAGVDARVAPAPLAEQLEALMEWAQDALHIFESPHERFRVSEQLVDEVEFEPATVIPAAAIIGVDAVWLHELDTGSPDPDAPRLIGHWRGWDPESTES